MPRPLPAGRRLPPWAVGALVAVLTLLQMVRRPTEPVLANSLYVEDGGIFLSNALNVGFLDTLRASYFGYLHTAPRVIAELAALAPLHDAALVMGLLTSIVVALLAVYVYEASAAWVASPLLRAVLGLAVVLVPVTARDLNGSISNLHWYLVYAAFWAAICPWRTRGWLVASGAVIGVAVLSDPITVVLLPLAIGVALLRRGRFAWAMPALLVLGLLAQLVLRDESTDPFGGHDWAIIPRTFAERVATPLFVGDRYLLDVFGGQTGSPPAWIAFALVWVGVAAGLALLRGRRRWLVGAGAVLSVTYFLIPMFTRGTFGWDAGRPWELGSSRYTYLPVMFLLAAMVALADRPGRDAGRRIRVQSRELRLPLRELAVALLVVGTIVTGYRAPHRTAGQLGWRESLRLAEVACEREQPGGIVDLYLDDGELKAIVPVNGPVGWEVNVPCSRLD